MLLATLTTSVAVTVTVVPAASAAPPNDPRCLPLAAGHSGLLVGGNEVPTTDSFAGGRPDRLGPVAPDDVAKTLPDTIVFQTRTEGVSGRYAFALREGALYARPAKDGVVTPGESWRVMRLPECLDGSITEISVDRALLIALGPERQIYTHNLALDLSPGALDVALGPVLLDRGGHDDVLRRAGVGDILVRQRRGVRRHLGPQAGPDRRGDRLRPAVGRPTHHVPRPVAAQRREPRGLRAAPRARSRSRPSRPAGSTVFAVSRRAELFTRLYDFDVSGANTVFGSFSWQQDRPASDTRWQLPGPEWVRQPVPPGTITDRLTIMRTAAKAGDRLLRVEGRTPRGRDRLLAEADRRPARLVAVHAHRRQADRHAALTAQPRARRQAGRSPLRRLDRRRAAPRSGT